MDNYKDMYYYLFNQTTDIIEKLKEIQRISEEMFISQEDNVEHTAD